MKLKLRDGLIMLACLIISAILCTLLGHFSGDDDYAEMIFLLGVAVTATLTDGFFWGISASVLGTFIVNYVFKKPYLSFTLKISGYPLTFFTMLTTACIISMLTTQIKWQSRHRAAAEREKLRADLLRALSHNMRTPLTSISGAADTLLQNNAALTPQTQLQLISGIKKESDWLIRAFENILTITRVDSGNAQLIKREELAEEVIAEVAASFKRIHPDINIITEIPQDIVMIPMDVLLIEQVLHNLMENAITHGGAAQIELALLTEGDNAVFRVSDNGRGISEEMLPRLFSGHFVNKENESDSKKSMGIGLSLCRSVVTLHGGSLTGYNSESGAVFQFTLPLGNGGQ